MLVVEHRKGWGIISKPSWNYAQYPAAGFLYLMGSNHPVVEGAAANYRPGQEPKYLEPFWAMIEDLEIVKDDGE